MFTNLEFSRIFGLSPYQTEYNLRQLIDEDLLTRFKRGFYILKTDPPSEQEIANALYKPSYISFDYALAYYNLIPEMVYEVTSATTKPTRIFNTDTLAYGYYTIKTKAYAGYILRQEGEKRFYIAEPEKAVVDYMYALALGQRGLLGRRIINDRLQIKGLSKEKIFAYTKLFNFSKLNELVEKVTKELL